MSVWSSLGWWQFALIGLLFVWSGFVRSGLGFGGAALTLPMLLLVIDDPILFLPAIALQLLLFSSLTIATRLSNVDWAYLGRLCAWLTIPVAAGLFGLLNLPGAVLSLFVYVTTLIYGVLYVLDRLVQSRSAFTDVLLLGLGGYASGVSLTGAPLIAAVAARGLDARCLRDTLFTLWIVLVIVKLATLAVAGVNFQISLAVITLPFAAIGHVLGMRMHQKILSGGRRSVHRVIGAGLCAVSVIGIWTVAPVVFE